jgi:nitric oxide dioxygenase
MLSAETIAVIKATVPVLKEHGETLTRHFYRRMFNGNPEVRAFFNPAHQHAGTQQKALAAAICAYAEHIENPAVLAGAVELIAQKHASLDVKPEHYPIVGEHLLGSIKEVLGDGATPQVIDAWAQAYGVLADILIKREGQIYAEHRQQHGWAGFAPFVVRRKVRESANITSFYLVPADGRPLSPFKPGQYITVRVPGTWHETTLRNYSLSGSPDAPYYRISVKREPAPAGTSIVAPAGHVSNYLHDRVNEGDRVDVGPPCGEFHLAPRQSEEDARPLVLVAGGVGATPVLSMLHAALKRGDGSVRDVWFIQGAVNGDSHAFSDELRELSARHPRLRAHIRYSQPTDADRARQKHNGEGVIDPATVLNLVGTTDAEFYFCGPKPMMAGLYSGLLSAGVAPAQLRYEFFGPAQDLQAAPPVAPAPAPVVPSAKPADSAGKTCCGACN